MVIRRKDGYKEDGRGAIDRGYGLPERYGDFKFEASDLPLSTLAAQKFQNLDNSNHGWNSIKARNFGARFRQLPKF